MPSPLHPKRRPSHYGSDYMEGLRAFADGLTMEDCPHCPNGTKHEQSFNDRRYEWISGWLDGKFPKAKYETPCPHSRIGNAIA